MRGGGIAAEIPGINAHFQILKSIAIQLKPKSDFGVSGTFLQSSFTAKTYELE
jgi:hypothetical protein